MNTIGLLLVLGLAFYALKQKSEKTRNMLLIASALLGFCMFSAEGFMVRGATGTPDDATCTETADGGSVSDDATLCLGVIGPDLDDATACEAVQKTATGGGQACTYLAADFEARDVAAADLPLLFPSCGEGTQVKVGGTLGSMCEAGGGAAVAGTADWGEKICGDGAECNATAGFLGGDEEVADGSNKCGSSLYDSWAHVCKCTDDTKTWALATKCTV